MSEVSKVWSCKTCGVTNNPENECCNNCGMPYGSDKYILMPKSLTAENGAKALLMGEFVERATVGCSECEDGMLDDYEPCGHCRGLGVQHVIVPVTWATIKAIYKMAAELGREL